MWYSSDLGYLAATVQVQVSICLVSQKPLHLILQHIAVDKALQLFYLLRACAPSLGRRRRHRRALHGNGCSDGWRGRKGREGGRKVTCGERKFKKCTRVSEAQLFDSHYIVIIRNVSISRHWLSKRCMDISPTTQYRQTVESLDQIYPWEIYLK